MHNKQKPRIIKVIKYENKGIYKIEFPHRILNTYSILCCYERTGGNQVLLFQLLQKENPNPSNVFNSV